MCEQCLHRDKEQQLERHLFYGGAGICFNVSKRHFGLNIHSQEALSRSAK